MFPRISKSTKNGKSYEYLVISESIHVTGKGSTTRNIANLGNIKRFNRQDVANLIDGFIRIFKLENYCLSEDVQLLESLEHGSIIFWQKIWDELGLSKIIQSQVKLKNKRIKLEVDKYVQMMVINRCVDPLSKLGVTRWIKRTCYKEMAGYRDLDFDVTYFYRSMDHLLTVKDDLEFAIFEKLKDLFSVNVKLTFYDITSSYFYTDNCEIGKNGYSRDNRPDREQIVIGVVTSFEGYPIKHYVFEGNRKDETTVKQVVGQLKSEYNIEDTTFVGDRGMITKLNLARLEGEGFDYIMGVKHRQDEICSMLLSEQVDEEDHQLYKGLKIRERTVTVKEFLIWKCQKIIREQKPDLADERFSLLQKEILSLNNKSKPESRDYKRIVESIIKGIDTPAYNKIFRGIKKYQGRYEDELRYIICLNEERKFGSQNKRQISISKLSEELDKVFAQNTRYKEERDIDKAINKIFEGYKVKFKKFFTIARDVKSKKAIGYSLNQAKIEQEKKFDGIFVLLSSRYDLKPSEVVESYKNLKEVEMLFDDLKNFVDIRPIRHWLQVRVRAHVFICVLALLLKRIFEIHYMKSKSTMEPLEEISESKLIKYKVKFSKREDRSQTFPKVTNTTPMQKKYFNMIGIKNPMSLEKFIW
ncbi:MAG: IS1634 family transposase [Desulfobacteraceae bacterium]|nr:IS1634 family transposase [Desulfobacteraceae bacterium]